MRLEKGERQVSVDEWLALGIALGVSPIELISDNPDQMIEVANHEGLPGGFFRSWVLGYHLPTQDPESSLYIDPTLFRDLANSRKWKSVRRLVFAQDNLERFEAHLEYAQELGDDLLIEDTARYVKQARERYMEAKEELQRLPCTTDKSNSKVEK